MNGEQVLKINAEHRENRKDLESEIALVPRNNISQGKSRAPSTPQRPEA